MDIKIAKYYNNAKSAFSFTFDDGCYKDSTLETVRIFKDIEKEFGVKIKGTSAQTVNFLHEDLISMWKEIIKEGYYDISSHSITHCVCYHEDTDIELRRKEAKDSKEALEAIYGVPVITFFTPGGGITHEGCEVLNEYYYANRSNAEYINNPDNLDYMYIGTYVSRFEHTDVKPFADYLDSVYENEGWGVQMNHWISNKESDVFHSQRANVFEDECRYAAKLASEGKMWIASFNDAIKYFKKRDNTKIKYEETPDGVSIETECSLPKDIFDIPLTLVIKSDTPLKITVNGKTDTYPSVNGEIVVSE